MGTDRFEVRGPCRCGNGEFFIEWSEPDHPWVKPGQGSWKSSIECAECNSRYSIVQRGGRFELVENVHLERRRNLRNQLMDLRKRFMDRPDVQDLLQQFAKKLDSFRFKAEIYRFLQQHGFYTGGTQATFTRNWDSPTKWLGENVHSPNDVLKVAAFLGADTAPFQIEIREIENLEAETRVPYPTVGDPIYQSKR
jgi:hypothetical protein